MAQAKKTNKKVEKKTSRKETVAVPPPSAKKVTAATGLLTRETVAAPLLSASKTALLDQWCAEHNKPDHIVAVTAGNVKFATDLKCPCGIMSLDVDCGGGLPANRMSIISGPDNSGKTYLMLKYMVMHQRLYGANSVIGLAIVEGFDYWRARQVGLMIAVPDVLIAEQNEVRRLDGRPPFTADEIRFLKTQIGDFRILRGDTGEETMGLVLDAVRSGLFGLIGIDSLNSMLPLADAEKDVGDQAKRAGNANLMTDFMKRYQPLTNALDERRTTTVIGLSQVRANAERANAPAPMQKYIKEWTDSMSWALRHLRSIGVQIHKGANEKDSGGQIIGHSLNWNIVKGKDGTHDGITGSTTYYHPQKLVSGTDDLGTVITEGIRLGVFQVQSNKAVHVIHPTTRELRDTIDNIPLLGRMLASDFEYELNMRRLVLLAAGKSCLYRPLQ